MGLTSLYLIANSIFINVTLIFSVHVLVFWVYCDFITRFLYWCSECIVCWPFRQLIFNHRQALLEQLSQETDAAMLLHLSVVVLFQTFTSNIVHAPGKCVPQIVTFLQPYLPPEQHDLLTRMQGKSRNGFLIIMQGEINYSIP